ncbi:carbohydrate kinase family protein [Natronosalvus halobius]|uniref:carbohydrate kinase family protein n=1 Tax=Natronosalvus halobius TaxID=2953746 RepID=UPI00209DDE36|nr:carbohydrate kinase family protein [Natronosalvus halobius]USZ73303.1 carbohydrate kinase family protein [Natronosalvus halobius]
MVTVLTAGHVNWDVTLRVDRFPEPDGEAAIRSQRQSGGGSAANVAAALATLEVEAGLVGSVGDDDNGLLARRELEAAGVDLDGVRIIEGADTAVKYILVDDDGEVAVLGNDGVNEAVRPSDLDPDRIECVDHVHLTSQRPDTAGRLARLASDAGVTVSTDPGRRLAERDYDEALAHADVIFANDREVESMIEETYPTSDFSDRILVVKYGGDGAEVHTPGGSIHHPGFDIEAVDTTGAGDAFAAGFLAMYLQTEDVERILEFANACGALAASVEGARCAPTVGAVEEVLDGARTR